jgi:hypothetical protein
VSENVLVADVVSTRHTWTGSGLADSVQGLVEAIGSEGWVADLVARVIVWAVEAVFVVTIPVVAAQIAAAVAKWAGRIFGYVSAMITSLTNLTQLLRG